MASNINKTECTKSASDKPRLIGEGILMYSERIDIRGKKLSEITKSGYLLVIGDKSFILEINLK